MISVIIFDTIFLQSTGRLADGLKSKLDAAPGCTAVRNQQQSSAAGEALCDAIAGALDHSRIADLHAADFQERYRDFGARIRILKILSPV